VRSRIVFLTLLAGSLCVPCVRSGDDPKPSDDEKFLAQAKVPTDGPGLLEFLRNRTATDEKRREIEKLVEQLADDNFDVREKATDKLRAFGGLAVPALRRALKSSDVEVAARAANCLKEINDVGSNDIVLAACHVLSLKKPPQATETLLAFLPEVEGRAVQDELAETLGIVAVRDGKADAALVKALEHKVPHVRAVAGEVLAASGLSDHAVSVAKLLEDKQPTVRARVAFALARAQDKSAIPVLIELLPELTPVRVAQAQEMLVCLAGTKAPKLGTGDRSAALKKYREDWQAWWKEHGDKANLAPVKTVTDWKTGALVRGTGAWDNHTPDRAFLGEGWNSGGFAPKWIEADLGEAVRLARIRLTVGQSPEGPTVHEIWISDEPIGEDRSAARLVHTFRGNTKNADQLGFDFSNRTSARYVQILTTQSPSWVSWSEIRLRVR
jgi:HEAT repeat protein